MIIDRNGSQVENQALGGCQKGFELCQLNRERVKDDVHSTEGTLSGTAIDNILACKIRS